ncbi:hypothetical protein AB685_20560 [Bacillus sp. LL01]|uniref:hypothetical protein n=1 Tax=Bacillus sp. LL01 TaxID=1665556 RepID=UPI00064D4323|nr:hypothetical protein [Bacillus sp. LL01]KMJ56663.1 hypothetical protein AB685_20560 [Bacillus sp. LL01]
MSTRDNQLRLSGLLRGCGGGWSQVIQVNREPDPVDPSKPGPVIPNPERPVKPEEPIEEDEPGVPGEDAEKEK